jgi:hypothetical protein
MYLNHVKVLHSLVKVVHFLFPELWLGLVMRGVRRKGMVRSVCEVLEPHKVFENFKVLRDS